MIRKGLARVQSVYAQVERVRLVELQQAAAALLEVVQVQALAAQTMVARKVEGRAALAAGDALSWRIAADACELEAHGNARTESLRVERLLLRDRAVDQHRASRLQAERVGRVVERLQQAERVCDERQEQVRADDRFGARSHWTRMKAG